MSAMTTRSIYNSVRGALDIFRNVNKGGGNAPGDGIVEKIPEYESSLSDEEILDTTNTWVARYNDYIVDIEQWQKDNEKYWLGKQYNPIEQAGTTKRALVDNAIFEAIETFLPIATTNNPDAVVSTASDPEAQQVGDLMRSALTYQADRQKLRMVLRGMTRHWMLYFIGVMKITWDVSTNDIKTEKVLPKKLILDPDAVIDEGGKYHGEYLGEYKKFSVTKLLKMFPGKRAEILSKGENKDGTRLLPIEWWTPTDVFYTLGSDVVLGKFKNPNWNWSGEVEVPDPEDPEGKLTQYVEGKNHLSQPEIPYLFLTVFNLGKQPHDETGLVYQVIPLQDNNNETKRQIAMNVKRMNNGIALNGKFFTKEQSSEALTQLENGGGLWVPNDSKLDGRMEEAFARTQPPALPADVFNNLNDDRQRLVGIFGTSGSNPQGLAQQDDVRGKIMAQQADSSRIGGGITQQLEQVADSWYNWMIQMMYVWYDEPHFAGAVGDTGAQELITIHNQDLTIKILVTVKEGSLIPKDPLTQRNEAMDLWQADGIDPISFYKRLEFPDPYNQAKQLYIWEQIKAGALPPQMMFPDLEMPPAPVPATQPGTGGVAVTGAPAQGETAPQGNTGVQEPVGQQGQQLIQSVPIKS